MMSDEFSKLTWVLKSLKSSNLGKTPTLCVSFSVSRLQHHESTGGQRESTWKQRPALGRRGRWQPRRRPGSGHASSDSRIAQPQIPPLPAYAHAPPPTAHAPPAGRGHCTQCGRRVLIFSAPFALLLPRREFFLIKDYFFKRICAGLDSTQVGTVRMDERHWAAETAAMTGCYSLTYGISFTVSLCQHLYLKPFCFQKSSPNSGKCTHFYTLIITRPGPVKIIQWDFWIVF